MWSSRDLLVLLGCGLAIGGCGSAVDDPNATSAGTGGDGRDELEQAIEACGPWAQRYVACYAEAYGSDSEYTVGYVSFMGYCISYFGYASIQGPACADALADYYACIAKLDCEEITGDGDEDGGEGDVPCEAQDNAREQVCDLFDDDGDSEDFPATDAGDASDASDDGVFTVTDGESSDDGDSTTTGGPPGGDSGSESSSTG